MITQKMSLANIQGKLSRAEMKNIMAGDGFSTIDANDFACKTSGKSCTKDSQCCSKACDWEYCAGA